jgi:exoribonuclease R
MTYDQAHNIMHGKPPDDKEKPIPPPLTAGAPVDLSNTNELKHDLSILTRLARKLRKDREDIGGAVDLSSGDQGSELKFTLDKDNKPTQVTAKKQLEIHNTIAELMILSNTWVANNIYERSPDSALLRIHRSVEDSRFEDLKEILNARKISFDGKNNRALANSLKEAENATKSNSVMKSLFQSLAIR